MDAEIERGSLSPTGVNQSILGTGVTESSDTSLNSIILVANYTPSGKITPQVEGKIIIK